jgi:FtsH-binding integral membrane protein
MSLVFAEYNIQRFPAAYGLSSVVSGILGLTAGPLVGTYKSNVSCWHPLSFTTAIFVVIKNDNMAVARITVH